MSGGFKDTFTKDDGKEGMLGYDDTAFYYFASSVLLCVAVPWTFSLVYDFVFPGETQYKKDFPEKTKAGSKHKYPTDSQMQSKFETARKFAKKNARGSLAWYFTKIVILAAIWAILYFVIVHLKTADEIKRFDPYQILDVASGSEPSDIKKSYRKLSLIYHPDKNPDDPLAASRFIQITKAYQALTDETAKANYDKYGNPDGPVNTKLGIGLPMFLLEKDNHLIILSIFFFLLLFVVPMTFICYYQRTKNYAANGVMIETLQFLGYYINESTRLKNCPELLAASAESRAMQTRNSDNVAMKPIMDNVTEHKKRQWPHPIILKNQFLLWAHMQRFHSLMSPELKEDLETLLKHSMRISQAMVEIACMREWFFTAQSMIEFRRCLVQALDIKTSPLLQVPHFTEECLKHCSRGKHSVNNLSEFISKPAEERKGIAGMSDEQQLDVTSFCGHISDVELRVVVEVEDEGEIVVGDVATVTCALHRKNLKEGEAAGPVHAPFYPEPKFEEWWLFLVEAPATRIIAFERIRDCERTVEAKLRFQVSRPGKHQLVLHALSDSYAGIDQKKEINFVAQTEEEVKREIIVHPEDEDLDLQPTLFQQFMGELGHDEESEEEEEEEEKRKSKTKKPTKELGGNTAAAVGKGDAGDADAAEKGDDAEDSDSSSSSSDSD